MFGFKNKMATPRKRNAGATTEKSTPSQKVKEQF